MDQNLRPFLVIDSRESCYLYAHAGEINRARFRLHFDTGASVPLPDGAKVSHSHKAATIVVPDLGALRREAAKAVAR